MVTRAFNGPYTGEHLHHVAFPLGGMGAGMFNLEGSGGIVDLSIHHHPQVFTKPMMFAALHVQGFPHAARVLEGPFPSWRVFGPSGGQNRHGATGSGLSGTHFGFPRFDAAVFTPRFPFAGIALEHPAIPVSVALTGWSPFIPGDADNSSLPVAALEYRFTNPTDQPIEAVFSYHATNMLAVKNAGANGVGRVDGGFVLWQEGAESEPWREAALIIAADDDHAAVDCQWFRGGWFDAQTILWQHISAGAVRDTQPYAEGDPSLGGSLYVPFALPPGEEKTIRVRLSWYVPKSNLRTGSDEEACACSGGSGCCGETRAALPTYRPWYAERFAGVQAVNAYWQAHYDALREKSARFRDAFFDSTLPAEVLEAVSANLSILKSPTVLRQHDGRLWGWEGSCECDGCCAGTCTHVWNYAQALPHLFPALERGLRETEFFEGQDARGHQTFRAWLPIRPITDHTFHAAADGQLGGIMKVYREWRVSGDSAWLRRLWPQVRQSLNYCIDTWDPERKGVLEEPHHNTYDIEFWGADGMCTSVYLGALLAAARMAEALGEDPEPFASLAVKSRAYLETQLFDGEYFIQQIAWQGLRAPSPVEARQWNIGAYSREARELLQREGPKYQYGSGCLSDGVLGAWLAEVCGVGTILDAEQVASHLRAVHRYNLRHDLSDHANPQRPGYALGREGGLLLCTWPKGGALTLPFVYSNEVWTGIEYQVAAHLIALGQVAEGLEIVRTARQRYDGRVRNPFDEYECGHWYARALSSYALLQALSGARYDAVEKVLYLRPRVAGDFRAFLCTATGYGVVGVRDGRPFLEVRDGAIDVERIAYQP